MIPSFMGLDVFINDALVARRICLPKAWHRRRCYRTRVQKKWTRRFGLAPLIADGKFFQADGALFMNSKTFDALKRQHAKNGRLQ